MADITRDSFDASKRYQKVVFERNKNVLDSDLNEAIDNLRVHAYRALWAGPSGKTGSALSDGLRPVGDGSSNQITIKAGTYQFYGYSIVLDADFNITGLTTPGGARTDTVWVSITEDEIDGAEDASIVQQLVGQTSVRRKLVVAFGVTENSATPPADSGSEPWAAVGTPGTKYGVLGHIFRTAVATINAADVVDRRHQLGGGFLYGQDRNIEVTWTKAAINSGGTQLTLTDLTISIPGTGFALTHSGDLTYTLNDGESLGWSGAVGSQLRRRPPAAQDFASTEDAGSSPLSVFTTLSTVPNDDTLVVARRIGSAFHLRGGKTLKADQVTYSDPNAHSTRTVVIPAAAGEQEGSGARTAGPKNSSGSWGAIAGTLDAAGWVIPISPVLPAGSVIRGIRVVVRDASSVTLEAACWRFNLSTFAAPTQIGSTPSSAGSAAIQTLTVLTGGSEAVAAGFNYVVAVAQISGVPTSVEVAAVEVDYDHPPA